MTTNEATDHLDVLLDEKRVGVWPSPKTVKLEVNCTTPKVLIPPRIAADITRIVKLCAVEVGWYCAVKRMPGHTYLLYDIHLPKQKVNKVTNEFDEGYLGEWQTNLAMKGEDSLANDFQLCWMHSHHTMSTDPSPQDDIQAKEAGKHGAPMLIRGIANKEGEIRFDIFYFGELHITFLKVPWELDTDHLPTIPPAVDWEQEMKTKVELKPDAFVKPAPKKESSRRVRAIGVGFGDSGGRWPNTTSKATPPSDRIPAQSTSSNRTHILIPTGPLHCSSHEQYESLLEAATKEAANGSQESTR